MDTSSPESAPPQDTGRDPLGPRAAWLGSTAALWLGATGVIAWRSRAGWVALEDDAWSALTVARAWAHGHPGPITGVVPTIWTGALAIACALREPSPGVAIGCALLAGMGALWLADRSAERDQESRWLAVGAVGIGAALPFTVGSGSADALAAAIGLWCADGVRRALAGTPDADLPLRLGVLGLVSPAASGAALGIAGWLWRRGSAPVAPVLVTAAALVAQGAALVWLGTGLGCSTWDAPHPLVAPAALTGLAVSSPPALIGAAAALLLAGGPLGWLAAWCSAELARRASVPVTLAGVAALAAARVVTADEVVDPRDARIVAIATDVPFATDVPGALAWPVEGRSVTRWCDGDFAGPTVTHTPAEGDRESVEIDVDGLGPPLRVWPLEGDETLGNALMVEVARLDAESGAVPVREADVVIERGTIVFIDEWISFYTNGSVRFEAPADGELVGLAAASIVEDRPARFSVSIAGSVRAWEATGEPTLLDFGPVHAGDVVSVVFEDDLVIGDQDRNASVGALRVLPVR